MKEIRRTILVAGIVAAGLQVVLHFCPVAPADASVLLAAGPERAIMRW